MPLRFSPQKNPILYIGLIAVFFLVFLLSGLEAAQAGVEEPFSLTLSVPDCKVISSTNTSVTYQLEKPVDNKEVYFRWDFTNGMDRTLENNLLEITLFNVDDNVEVKLDRGKPSDFQNFNGTTIEAGDFKYTKLGRKPDPKIRRVEFTLKSSTLEPSKNYILKIGPKYEANNGNTLNKTYSWQFTTSEAGTVTTLAKQPDPDGTGNDSNVEVNPEKSSHEEPAAGGSGDGTGGGQDEPLELVSSTPADGAGGVAVDTEIRLSFSKNVINMMVKDANLECFSLYAGNEPIAVKVKMADDQIEPEYKKDVVLVPVESLKPGTSYTIKVDPELKSKSGVTLGEELKLGFTTANGTENTEVAVEVSNEKAPDSSQQSEDKGKSSIPAIVIITVIATGVLICTFIKRKK